MTRTLPSTSGGTPLAAWQVPGLAFAYYALTLLGTEWLSGAAPLPPVWPSAGLSLAAFLLFGLRCWPGVFLGSLAAHLTTQDSFLAGLAAAIGETLGPVIGARAMLPSMPPAEMFRRVRNACRFFCFGVLAGPAIGAAIDTFGSWMLGRHSLDPPFLDWFSNWLGSAAGTLMLAPWLLELSRFSKVPALSLEYGVHWSSSTLLSLFIFAGWLHPETAHYPLAFLLIPLLVWAGLRFSTLGVTTSLLTITMVATVGTAHGSGPLFPAALSVSPPLLGAYILVVCGTTLLMHVLVIERTESGEQLRKNQARLLAILDTAADGIVTIDEHGRIELFNPAAALMFGYAPEEMLGQNINRLIPEGDRQIHDRSLAAYVATGRSHALQRVREVRGLRKNGSSFPVEITIGEYEDAGRRFTGILRDIGARKGTEQALRDSQQRLELALAGGDLGIWDWRVQSGEAVFDERWVGMLGYDIGEIEPTYHAWERLLHPDDKQRVLPLLNAHLAGETPFYEAEFRLLTRDGQWKWILARGKVFERDAVGHPVRAVGIHSDISMRVQLEERLREQQAELLFVQRLTTAGELAATMAHELNQPLGAIAGYVTGIARRFRPVLQEHPELRQALLETERLSKRAADVVSSIRDLVRRHESETELLAPGALIQATLALARPELVRRQVRVEPRIAAALPPIRGQRVLLQQLLLNLILNALEAMDRVEVSRRRLAVQAHLTDERWVEIRIADTGPGIPAEIAARLFEPFVSSKPNGMGLGLSICRTIAETHGGSIKAYSAPGEMTTFSVTLPGVEAESGRHGE